MTHAKFEVIAKLIICTRVDTVPAARGRRVRGRPRTCVAVTERDERDGREKRGGIRVEARWGKRGAHVDSQKLRMESRVPRAESRETRRVEGRRDSRGESRRREWKWKSRESRIESRRAEQMFCFDQYSWLSARVRSNRVESSRVESSRVESSRVKLSRCSSFK